MSGYSWLYILALLPWALIFLRDRRKAPRILFAPIFLLTSRRSRKRRRLREIMLAASRCAALCAFITLLAPADPPTDEGRNVPSKPLERVLIVDGSDSGPLRFSQNIDSPSVAEYLTYALDLAVERVPSSDLAEYSSSSLREFDAVVLADVSSPTPVELERLTGFTRDGKRFVLIWSGNRVVPEHWNAALRELGSSAKIVDVETRGSLRGYRGYRGSPFCESFPDAKHARIDALPVERFQGVEGGEALLSDVGGGVVFARLATGWYWFGASPDPNAGALSTAPYFATLVDRVLAYAGKGGEVRGAKPKDDLRTLWWAVLLAAMALELALARVPTRDVGEDHA